jgi:N-acetylglucosaminylphosphatidylinositol deacetylase
MFNDYLLDTLASVQDNMKYFLSIMIGLNFLVIFLLKFSINLREKFSDFFDLPKKYTKEELSAVKEVLLLTAHPDDEVMFFTPTLRALLAQGIKIRLLCLSNGNFDGLGRIREVELKNVCKTLAIELEITDDDKLKDDIRHKWDSELVATKLTEYMNKDSNLDKIGTIITFDEYGITNHPNHISCYDGLM